uniref:LysM domain-containing protein n=1 Tax=Amphora coffeiformis TaxID=265554 RepID=A0A7S3L5H9_9STRA
MNLFTNNVCRLLLLGLIFLASVPTSVVSLVVVTKSVSGITETTTPSSCMPSSRRAFIRHATVAVLGVVTSTTTTTAATTIIHPQQQQPQQYQPHVVLPDDTWQGICLRYKITPLQLRRANGGFSGTQLTLAPPVLKIPVTQPKNNNNTSSSSTMTTRQQDTSSPAYKLQVLRHHFPTLNVEQAQAFLEVHDGDLQAAQQSLLQLCGGGGVHVSSSAGGTTE